MKEQDVVFEVGNFWVRRVESGHYDIYRIYKAGVTASVRVGSVQFSDDDAKARTLAVQQCTARNDKEQQT